MPSWPRSGHLTPSTVYSGWQGSMDRVDGGMWFVKASAGKGTYVSTVLLIFLIHVWNTSMESQFVLIHVWNALLEDQFVILHVWNASLEGQFVLMCVCVKCLTGGVNLSWSVCEMPHWRINFNVSSILYMDKLHLWVWGLFKKCQTWIFLAKTTVLHTLSSALGQ